ncbi:CotD family spore coat protein [Scopulibacillus cellulosilyticus]|uniref:CotD family spore coat protein n=1 Tax=Scopulibacillus cellulosilyticus TaxID=2665665 RepID=A0ABW2PVN8_9BACL
MHLDNENMFNPNLANWENEMHHHKFDHHGAHHHGMHHHDHHDAHHHGMHHHDGGNPNMPYGNEPMMDGTGPMMDGMGPMMDGAGPCPPKVMPEVVCDPQYSQQNYYENIVVPYIHPSHTLHWKHTHVTNAHYYPHTESMKCTESCEDVNCGCVLPQHLHHPHHPQHPHHPHHMHHHGKF